ncbi:MAG: YifB family Mg chelatase-like AAA ATPase [Paludibacteraceae bacterium]|nr:YifB family Mg chelatase-like AAA ATPase [Paludibacteraceae bacterium]
MLVKTFASAVIGIDAVPITIEVSSSRGADFTLVGLPDSSVKESRERISSALMYSGCPFPRSALVINMAPADIRKEGAAYDLPLAIGILASNEKVRTAHLSDYMIMGELSLDGSLQPVRGILPMALCARKEGYKGMILPAENAQEAAVVGGLEVLGMHTIREVIDFLNDELVVAPTVVDIESEFRLHAFPEDLDFSDVRGQENVRRALEVAAAGGHNIIMVGPPGAGKSMMAKRLPSILPPLTLDEALETTKIHSVAGLMCKKRGVSAGLETALITQRPFRSPHHTITDVGMCGGTSNPRPGEISLAHNGILFLDELPEFRRAVLEVMRQPLEDRKITISRAKGGVEYPASFTLVAAMNPCPCGHWGDPTHTCTCTPAAIHKYLSRISGPLLDRIDIQVPIQAVPFSELQKAEPGEPSAPIRARVIAARDIQTARFAHDKGIHCNAQMTSRLIRKYCKLDEESEKMLEMAMTRLGLSARAYDRILKVSRTIADLEGSPDITMNHLREAISYRELDKEEQWL